MLCVVELIDALIPPRAHACLVFFGGNPLNSKNADIGLAMGIQGSEAAKTAASMLLVGLGCCTQGGSGTDQIGFIWFHFFFVTEQM